MAFRSLTPMLHTLDLIATRQWYEDILGFRVVSKPHPAWIHIVRDRAELMFMTNDHLGAPTATGTQYITVDNVMALYDAIKDRVTVEWGPERMPYGMLEFAIRDINGYLLSFGQDVSSQT